MVRKFVQWNYIYIRKEKCGIEVVNYIIQVSSYMYQIHFLLSYLIISSQHNFWTLLANFKSLF